MAAPDPDLSPEGLEEAGKKFHRGSPKGTQPVGEPLSDYGEALAKAAKRVGTSVELLRRVWPHLQQIRPTADDISSGFWRPEEEFWITPPPIRMGLTSEMVGPQMIDTDPEESGLKGCFGEGAITLNGRLWRQLDIGERLYLVTHEALHARGFIHEFITGHARFNHLVVEASLPVVRALDDIGVDAFPGAEREARDHARENADWEFDMTEGELHGEFDWMEEFGDDARERALTVLLELQSRLSPDEWGWPE